ncbi:hypothetical protein HMPREF9005_1268 [Actinomyces sp. oral taxon 178 str. F0338]|nr:hypothetical protein HMPREF9005_1268 [Actinomyces sp. oral taxon 178 str. F0338]
MAVSFHRPAAPGLRAPGFPGVLSMDGPQPRWHLGRLRLWTGTGPGAPLWTTRRAARARRTRTTANAPAALFTCPFVLIPGRSPRAGSGVRARGIAP